MVDHCHLSERDEEEEDEVMGWKGEDQWLR